VMRTSGIASILASVSERPCLVFWLRESEAQTQRWAPASHASRLAPAGRADTASQVS